MWKSVAVGPWLCLEEEARDGDGDRARPCGPVCYFAGVAVTDPHTLGSLQQRKFIFSHFWRPEVQNRSVGRAVTASEAPGENTALLSPASGAASHCHGPTAQSRPRLAAFLPGSVLGGFSSLRILSLDFRLVQNDQDS